jgi:hypothetical protein
MGGGAGTGGTGGGGASSLSMFVMFDRSGSMRECPDGTITTAPLTCPLDDGPNRWDNAALGLASFFQAPSLAGVGVAFRFFPDDSPTPGCTDNTTTGCDASACSQPLVPLLADPRMLLPRLIAGAAPADAHEGALVAAIAATYPSSPSAASGNTGGPTYPALVGAHAWAGTYRAAHPTEETIIVFVTDGLPIDCVQDTDIVAFVAADGLARNGVETHVIGLGEPEAELVDLLNAVALAGGTSEAVVIPDSSTANADLLAALQAIRDRY